MLLLFFYRMKRQIDSLNRSGFLQSNGRRGSQKRELICLENSLHLPSSRALMVSLGMFRPEKVWKGHSKKAGEQKQRLKNTLNLQQVRFFEETQNGVFLQNTPTDQLT